MFARMRRKWMRAAVIVGSSWVLHGTGCGAAWTEFRSVAGPSLQQGVKAIVNGLLDGVFAVADPSGSGSTSGQ